MSCPCGNSICDCRVECLCIQSKCQCNQCSLLPNICSRCNQPFYIILHQRENVSICSCKAKNLSESDPLSQNSATYNENAISAVRKTQCPRCSLPIIILTKRDYYTLDSCCCSHKNSNSTGTSTTEHETSNCTSDHRDAPGDRQARKMSRRTRKEKSNWQYKKTKGKHLTNSEDNTDTETLTSEEFPVEDSAKPVEDNPELRVSCTGSATSDSNQNFNFGCITQCPTEFFSRTAGNAIGNASIFADTSGFCSPSTSKDFLSLPENLGFLQLSQNARPKLPPPFRTLPNPMPGLPTFSNCGERDSTQQTKKSRSLQPPLVDQPALARAEKMEKWFESLQSVLTTSGELPDAETAAVLDKEDKEKVEQQPKEHSACNYEIISAEHRPYVVPVRISPNSSRMSHSESATYNRNNGKELDVIDPTTDTERSSSLSKSHKESESD